MLPPELAGPWLCEAQRLKAIVSTAPLTGSTSWSAVASRAGVRVVGGVAIITISGVLAKTARWWFDGSSMGEIQGQVAAAAADPAVSAILLGIDSPGGTVAGTNDLATAVAGAAKAKPTYAHVQDLCASAAYWIASQCAKIFATPTSLIGSIGTYGVVIDSSGMADKAGVKVHVVRAGQFKGMGLPGTPIEKAHLDEAQRIITGLNEHFLAGVRSGRQLPMAKVRELADGRLHFATDAVRYGLIDGVQSLQATYESLALGKGIITTAAAASASVATTKGKAMYQGEAAAEWEEAIKAKIDQGKSRDEAIRAVVREKPDLHSRYLAEHNERYNERPNRRR